MIYNTSNPLDKANFLLRAKKLAESGVIVDLTEKKPRRSLPQNKYLHVILAYFGAQTGNTLEWVKQQYYKKLVNPDLFIREKEDKYLGRIKILRSSADLDTSEFSLSIERFRNWAAQEAGIYIPSADEAILIQQMEIEIERNKEFL
nr:MAG TPA: NinB recombination protein [Caudoviricetes sp.]